MKVTPVTNTSDLRRELFRLIEQCNSFAWASAWVTQNNIFDAALSARSKMDALVIGTHQYITDVECLEACLRVNKARVVAPGAGPMFHPKLYAFNLGGSISIYVGSSNLTNGGMTRNIEAGAILTAELNDPNLMHFLGFIEQQWQKAETITDDFVMSYRANKHRVQDSLDELKTFTRIKKPKRKVSSAYDVDPNFMDWSEFTRLVKADRTDGLKSRLRVLSLARQMFSSRKRFADFTDVDQKCVMGILKPQVHDDVDWGYFGQMSSFGYYYVALREHANTISHALDQVPLVGGIKRKHYDAFVKQLKRIPGASESWLGMGTRLLAMKRPDYFVCICNPNKKQIADAYSTAYSTLDLDNYWERVIDPMQLMPWWQQEMPDDKVEQDIWNGRAAMLDAIYYDPKQR